MIDYLDALMYAAEEGYKSIPYVSVEICAPCHGIKLHARYSVYEVQDIVGWEEFKATRFPMMLLTDRVRKIREALSKFAVPKMTSTPGIVTRMPSP